MSIGVDALGRAIKQVQTRHHRMLDACLWELGSSLAQWDALRAIHRNPRASSHALAEYTFQTDQSFGALAKRLMENGLIRRAGGKGRAIFYELTETGYEIFREGQKRTEKVLAGSFSALTEDEKSQLSALLAKLIEQGS